MVKIANVNASVVELAPVGGIANAGWKLGLLDSASKAAQNDTVTVVNASAVSEASNLRIDATGAAETFTVSDNVFTLTSATTGSVSGIIVYKS